MIFSYEFFYTSNNLSLFLYQSSVVLYYCIVFQQRACTESNWGKIQLVVSMSSHTRFDQLYIHTSTTFYKVPQGSNVTILCYIFIDSGHVFMHFITGTN